MFLTHQDINNKINGAEGRHFNEGTNWISKKYELESLLDNNKNICDRIKKIDSIAKKINLKIEWNFGKNTLTRYTEKITKSSRKPTKEDCKEIARIVSFAHGMDLVHGDINKKNLIIHENGILLSDWEPSLIQLKKGKTTLMATYPYIDPCDMLNKQITKKTDLFALACYFISASEGSHLSARRIAINNPEIIIKIIHK